MKHIRKNHRQIQYSNCFNSFHKSCTVKIDKSTKTLKSSYNDWKCRNCINPSFPFNNIPDEEFINLFQSEKINRPTDHSLINCNANSTQAKVMPEINNFDIPSIYYDSILNDEQYIPSDKIPKLLSNQKIKTSFTAFSLNKQPLNNIHNFLKLESFLHSINVQPSILAITETRLKKNHTNPHTNLCNYTFVSNSRSQSRGGGVGLYVKCSLNFTMRPDLTITHEKNFESLFIEIESNNSTMICGVIYRPPFKNSKKSCIIS